MTVECLPTSKININLGLPVLYSSNLLFICTVHVGQKAIVFLPANKAKVTGSRLPYQHAIEFKSPKCLTSCMLLPQIVLRASQHHSTSRLRICLPKN